MKAPESSLATARVRQPLVCMGLLAAIGLAGLVLDTAVHSEAFGMWLDRKRVEGNDTPVAYERQFIDTEDRVALSDLAELDPSSGGVYFFGASNMKWGMEVPNRPPEERKLVHNFGSGEASPYFHHQFTNYLIRYKNILSAGPEKTLVVFGTTFMNARPAHDAPKLLFSNLWRRYGLYRYDFQRGIEPVSWGSFWDAYALERARCASFVQGTMVRGAMLAVPRSMRQRRNEKDPAILAANYKRILGPTWEDGIREHRRELQDWFDDLRRQGIEFQIVLLPLGSWHGKLPYPPKYQAMIEEFCKTNHVDLTDCTHLLKDDEFVDHSHPNLQGLPKLDGKLMEIARKFLEAHGAWPAAGTRVE
jgi:hypothetical protein